MFDRTPFVQHVLGLAIPSIPGEEVNKRSWTKKVNVRPAR